jgi:hypothetical protein
VDGSSSEERLERLMVAVVSAVKCWTALAPTTFHLEGRGGRAGSKSEPGTYRGLSSNIRLGRHHLSVPRYLTYLANERPRPAGRRGRLVGS